MRGSRLVPAALVLVALVIVALNINDASAAGRRRKPPPRAQKNHKKGSGAHRNHGKKFPGLGAVDDNPAGTCHAFYNGISYNEAPPYCLLSDGGNLCSEGYIPSLNKTGLVGIPFVGYPVGYYTQVGSSCPCSCMDINGPSPPQDYLKQHNCNVQTEGSYGKQINCLDVMKLANNFCFNFGLDGCTSINPYVDDNCGYGNMKNVKGKAKCPLCRCQIIDGACAIGSFDNHCNPSKG